MKNQTARNSTIELLRIMSIIMIIACHLSHHGGFQFSSSAVTVPRLWLHFIEMGGNMGVNIFVLISGYFLIQNNALNISIKKVLKFWGMVFFYSAAMFILAFAIGKGNASPVNCIETLFPITFKKWWFASTYFVMFLLHPYINRLLRSFTQKEYIKFLILIFIMWSVIPTFTSTDFQSNRLIEFFMYYAIAGYIKLYGFGSKLKSRHFFIMHIVFAAITYLSAVVFMVLGTKIPALASHTMQFYPINSVLTLLRAVTLFAAFTQMPQMHSRVINKTASVAFAVYLIHDSSLMRSYIWSDLFKVSSFQNSNWIIAYSIGVVIIVYAVCAAVDFIRQFIFEKPYMKLVSHLCDSVIEPACDNIKMRAAALLETRQ